MLHFNFAIFLSIITISACNEIVNTNAGLVRGSLCKSIPDSKEYLSFTGIPYARPPVEDLRFKDPVPAKPWTDVLDATKPAPKCLQFLYPTTNIEGQEDCLYLNVYTPKDGLNEPKAVMVWIHGGGWKYGSGNANDDVFGPEYIMNEDVVLVTLNYRLGVLGFLSTEDSEAPGNYGLLDMTLALEWIQENIENFGGNKRKVTIFGESAGGGAVHLLMLSARAKGLFHQAIAQSGTAYCPWALEKGSLDTAKRVAAAVGCPADSPKELIKCLKKSSSADLLRAQESSSIVEFLMFPFLLVPRVDKEREKPFLHDIPDKIIQAGKFNDVPLITGITEHEAQFFHETMINHGDSGYPKLDGPNREKYLTLFLQLNSSIPEKFRSKAIAQIISQYFDGKEEVKFAENLDGISHMLGDRLFYHGFLKTLRKHSTYGRQPIYSYVFSHPSKYTYFGEPKSNKNYTYHADDVLVQFKHYRIPELSGADLDVSRTINKLWTTFAETGVPNIEGLEWRPIDPWNFSFLRLTENPHMEPEDNYPFKNLSVWDSILQFDNIQAEDIVREEL